MISRRSRLRMLGALTAAAAMTCVVAAQASAGSPRGGTPPPRLFATGRTVTVLPPAGATVQDGVINLPAGAIGYEFSVPAPAGATSIPSHFIYASAARRHRTRVRAIIASAGACDVTDQAPNDGTLGKIEGISTMTCNVQANQMQAIASQTCVDWRDTHTSPWEKQGCSAWNSKGGGQSSIGSTHSVGCTAGGTHDWSTRGFGTAKYGDTNYSADGARAIAESLYCR